MSALSATYMHDEAVAFALRWSHFVGQADGLVKVYSGV